MLTATDPLANHPRRVVVAGVSGVGKTTLARRIARVTGAPHTELDALFHGPDWTPRLPQLDADGAGPPIVWLRSRREVDQWMSGPLATAVANGEVPGAR